MQVFSNSDWPSHQVSWIPSAFHASLQRMPSRPLGLFQLCGEQQKAERESGWNSKGHKRTAGTLAIQNSKSEFQTEGEQVLSVSCWSEHTSTFHVLLEQHCWGTANPDPQRQNTQQRPTHRAPYFPWPWPLITNAKTKSGLIKSHRLCEDGLIFCKAVSGWQVSQICDNGAGCPGSEWSPAGGQTAQGNARKFIPGNFTRGRLLSR